MTDKGGKQSPKKASAFLATWVEVGLNLHLLQRFFVSIFERGYMFDNEKLLENSKACVHMRTSIFNLYDHKHMGRGRKNTF